jgi:lysophospholipase L1-like esterase
MLTKVVCLGDSITKGKVWNENERRPYITENSYPIILKKLMNVDVVNNGICDITSEEMLHNMSSKLNIDKGSLVIVEVGGNDCNFNWKEVKKNPDREHDAIIPLECFKNNLQKIIDIIYSYGAVPVLSTLPPLDDVRYYNLLKKIFGEGIKKWIDCTDGIFRWQERYSNMVKSVAESTGTFLIDVRKSFLDTQDYKKLISFDGLHPNEEGYMLIARTCLRELKFILSGL